MKISCACYQRAAGILFRITEKEPSAGAFSFAVFEEDQSAVQSRIGSLGNEGSGILFRFGKIRQNLR